MKLARILLPGALIGAFLLLASGPGTRFVRDLRLEGNNVEAGKATLAASGLNIIPADDLADASQKAVAAIAA